jgi:hypothetical protein
VSFLRKIDGVPYLDETRLWSAVSTKKTPIQHRLQEFMRQGGVRFFDEEPGGYKYILQPSVAITGFGGIPVKFNDKTPADHVEFMKVPVKPSDILAEFKNTMGRAGFYSYMNPGNHTPEAMDGITTKLSHFSKAHTVPVDMALLGYSAAIEGNMMLLRRWFNHVGRCTNTRAAAQADPPLVVMEPSDLPLAKAVRGAIADILSKLPLPRKDGIDKEENRERLADHFERVNGLWPNSRGLVLMVNADISNLRSTMGDIADKGQELEQRRLLAMVNDTLQPLFPEMLKHSSSYGYEMPAHWPDKAAWQKQKNK